MLRDIRYAVRSLRRWRFGAAMAIITLTIAIGTATSLYAFLRASLGKQTPQIEDIEEVARIYASNRSLSVERGPTSLLDFQTALSKATSFDSIAAYEFGEREIVVGATNATIAVCQ